MSEAHRNALVLFSGGQDSATCLAYAVTRYERVETIGFDYGQRHRVELTLRPGAGGWERTTCSICPCSARSATPP